MKREERILNAVERLKLPSCASVRQIRKRYREMVKAHHPDRQKGTQDPEMAAINEAYAILMDYCHNYKIRMLLKLLVARVQLHSRKSSIQKSHLTHALRLQCICQEGADRARLTNKNDL